MINRVMWIIPTNVHSSHNESHLRISEVNEAVIQIMILGRSPTMRLVAVATGEGKRAKGRTILVDDCQNSVFEGDAQGGLSDEPKGQTPRKEL